MEIERVWSSESWMAKAYDAESKLLSRGLCRGQDELLRWISRHLLLNIEVLGRGEPQLSDGDYDKSIHSNPDALVWAKFFVETCEQNNFPHPPEDLMHAWFANAMMAMRDWLIKTKRAPHISSPSSQPQVTKGKEEKSWIKTADRPPTKEDANRFGDVLWMFRYSGKTEGCRYRLSQKIKTL